MVSDEMMVSLLDGIAGKSSGQKWSRSQWVDSVTDQLDTYSAEQAARLVAELVDVAVVAETMELREAVLHAVAELVVWHPETKVEARQLCTRQFADLSRSEEEYLEFLCS